MEEEETHQVRARINIINLKMEQSKLEEDLRTTLNDLELALNTPDVTFFGNAHSRIENIPKEGQSTWINYGQEDGIPSKTKILSPLCSLSV